MTTATGHHQLDAACADVATGHHAHLTGRSNHSRPPTVLCLTGEQARVNVRRGNDRTPTTTVRQLRTVCAGAVVLLTASACTATATHPRPTVTPPPATQVQARQAGPSPVAAATLRAIAAAEVGTTITPVTDPYAMRADVPHLARSEARAIRAALGAWPRSKIMGITLAWVTMSGPGFNERPRLVWLVSVDPYGGAFVEGTPACGTYDYIVDFIDPATGRMLVGTAASKVTGLRPLPVIGPTPSIASSNSCPPGPL